MNQIPIPILALGVSLLTAIVAYFNYRLNRTLNIKSQLYNEKLKLYRDITKEVAKLMFFIGTAEDILGEHLAKGGLSEKLDEIAAKIDRDSENIDLLMIEAHMIAPNSILLLMEQFSDCVNTTYPQFHLEDVLNVYIEEVAKLRTTGDSLITGLRNDLRVSNLNKTLSKL